MAEDTLRFEAVQTEEQIATAAALADVIWHECFAKILEPAQIDYMVDHIQSAPAMTRQIAEEGYEYYLLVPGGSGSHPAGYLSIRQKDGQLMLSKLYILKEMRGRGYARQALSFVEETGRAKGCDGVWLTVNRYNEKAIAVYRKTGFEKTREQVADIGGGYVMDDFIFEKPL